MCLMTVSSNVTVMTNVDFFKCNCHSASGKYTCGYKLQDSCYASSYHVHLGDKIFYLMTRSICECPAELKRLSTEEYRCSSHPCHNGATCVDNRNGRFQCFCVYGFKGFTCADEYPCHSQPCHNGATCVEDNTNGTFRCICPLGFKGITCAEENPCYSQPCHNEAACVDNNNGTFLCKCPIGFTGIDCADEYPCNSQPCYNGATCVNNNESFRCNCPLGFRDITCAKENPCSSQPCHNGATCVDENEAFLCHCPPGFRGNTCADESPCNSQPCHNKATCVNNNNGTFRCICPPGFSGIECADAQSQKSTLLALWIAIGVAAACSIPLFIVLIRCYQNRRIRKATKMAYRAEREILDRMSSAHFGNPAYLSNKELQEKLHAGRNLPPPIKPRPGTSLPAATKHENNYIYMDHPGLKAAPDNGEYIYVMESMGNAGRSSCGFDSSGAVPSAPAPSAGEYIYFDQSMSAETQFGSSAGGQPLPTNLSPDGTLRKPAPTVASIRRPLPHKPSSATNSFEGSENIYEELPGEDRDGIAELESPPTEPIEVEEGGIDRDIDLDLQP